MNVSRNTEIAIIKLNTLYGAIVADQKEYALQKCLDIVETLGGSVHQEPDGKVIIDIE